MTIQASAQNKPIVTLNPGLKFSDSNGNLSNTGRLALQNIHSYVVGTNRIIPCNAVMASNVVTLTLLDVQPLVTQYVSYDTYRFVAPANSTGALTAQVVTNTGTLPTLNVYLPSGSSAGNGAVVQNCLYDFIYNDSLNSGSGGFQLRGSPSIMSLTDSTGGTVSNTISAISGTTVDTTLNNNFASLAAKLDAILSAIAS